MWRRRSFRSPRRTFRRRQAARPSNKKWIAQHVAGFVSAVQIDPVTTFRSDPTFIELVSPADYNLPDALDLTLNSQAGEAVKVLRTIGHVGIIPLPDTPGVHFAYEFWWYLAAMSLDDVTNAQLLLASEPTSFALDTYSAGLEGAPALWNKPVRRYGFVPGVYRTLLIETEPSLNVQPGVEAARSFSWDFNPRAMLRHPMCWYLVCGMNAYQLSGGTPPAEFSASLIVMARTLVAD